MKNDNLQINNCHMFFVLFFLKMLAQNIIQLFHTFLCNSQNYHTRGTVDELMNCCPRPKAEGNSSSGHPQHRGGDNLTVAQKDLE